MTYPFVSIIIPTWRDNYILNTCLSSINDLDYPTSRLEIILSSKNKLRTKKIKFKIKKIIIPINSHHAKSRNLAVKIAKGKIIAFIDDDCIVPKDWLKKAVKYFDDKRVGLIGGPIPQPRNQNLLFRFGGYLMSSPFGTGLGGLRWRMGKSVKEASEIDLILANNLMRRSIFNQIGGFDKDQVPCEENHLYGNIMSEGYKLLYVPEIFVYHRSKPLLYPLIKKIFFYSTGRGIFIARFPQNFKFTYILPSLFTFGAIIFPIITYLSNNRAIYEILFFIIGIYLLFSVLNSLYIFVKFEKNLLILLLIPLSVFFVHFSYGLGFLYGLLMFLINRWQGGIEMNTKA